jgi:carboxypeptidase T
MSGMTKKGMIILVILTILSSFFLMAGSRLRSRPGVISMSLEDYRVYLSDNRPLDRLFMIDNICYFLVTQQKKDILKKQGVNFLIREFDLIEGIFAKTGSIGDYHTYMETVEMLQELARLYPDRAMVFSAGQSLEGREIYVIKISDNVTVEESEPNIFISGCHHAREWISVEIPLLFARYLLENYSSNPQVRNTVERGQIFIMPIQNPDGLEYSIHYYRMWRKNRRYNGELSWGVDNNRNYGYKWGIDDIGSSPIPDSGVYRGPDAFSEPETCAVRDLLLEHPPSGSLNFHNHSQLILYPWGYTATPTKDDAEMESIAKHMAELIFQVNGRVYQYGAGAIAIYPTNGDTDDWIYATFGTPSFTVELPPELFIQGGFFTSQEMIQSAFNEMCPAMLYFTNTLVDKFYEMVSE